MPVYVLTKRDSLQDAVTAAAKTSAVQRANTTAKLLDLLLSQPPSKSSILVFDLTSVPDGERLIIFLKGSAHTSFLPVVCIAGEARFADMDPHALASLSVMVFDPYTPTELSAAIAKVKESLTPP